jgi:hypothetical protein
MVALGNLKLGTLPKGGESEGPISDLFRASDFGFLPVDVKRKYPYRR